MNSLEILRSLKLAGFHLTIINIETGIPWHRLNRTYHGKQELSESEYRDLLEYANSKGVTDENSN
jgi:hypothetical protein